MGLFDGLKKAIGGNVEQGPSPEIESAALIKQYEGRVARINAMEVRRDKNKRMERVRADCSFMFSVPTGEY